MCGHKGCLRYTVPHNRRIEQTIYYLAAMDLGYFYSSLLLSRFRSQIAAAHLLVIHGQLKEELIGFDAPVMWLFADAVWDTERELTYLFFEKKD
jgi:hypothetical protein